MTKDILAELSNGTVGVRLRRDAATKGIGHEVFAGGTLAAAIARSVSAGLDDVGDIRIPLFSEFAVTPDKSGGGTVRLTGATLGGECVATIAVPAQGRWIHVDVTLKGITSPAASLVYEFVPEKPDFAFAPHLRPADRDVVSRWGMKTPLALVQAKSQLCGVVADVPMLEAMPRELPVILEMDCDRQGAKLPVLGMGIRPHTHHSLYCFETPAKLDGSPALGDTRFSYFIVVDGSATEKLGYMGLVKEIWERFGHSRFDNVKPQVTGFDRYARLGFDYARRYLWESMEGGRGGVRSGVRYQNDIWFQTLFNQLRSAIGFKIFGRRWSDGEVESMGDQVKYLALSAPQTQEGLFPTVFEAGIEQAVRVERWHKANHWMTSPWVERSMRKVLPSNPVKLIDWDQTFHLVDNSWQCYWMLRWHREVEPDAKLVAYCERYAAYLVSLQQTAGTFPSFLHGDELRVGQLLMHNVGSAASGAFLAQLYLETKDERWLAAAERAAGFVAKEVLPSRCWQDYEVIFDSKGKPLGLFDRHTNQYAQVTQGMMWTAAMFQGLAEARPDGPFLGLAEQVVDYLSLYQQMWNVPFLSVQTFGGFPVGNGHPGWNDGRTSMIAQTLLDQYRIGGRLDHFERGIAALRTSLVLMFMPENAAVSRWANDGALGNSDMSYGGRGVDERWCGYTYDFPVGPVLAAYALALDKFGDIFVDVERRHAVGVNGYVVSGLSVDERVVAISVAAGVPQDVAPRLKVRGLKQGCRIRVNGIELDASSTDELEAGVRLPRSCFATGAASAA